MNVLHDLLALPIAVLSTLGGLWFVAWLSHRYEDGDYDPPRR